MLKTSRRLKVVVSACFVLLVGAFTSALYANHAWSDYHWPRSDNPVAIAIADNVAPAWDSYLDEAISDWDASSVVDLTEVAHGQPPRECVPVPGRVEVCAGRFGNNGWLGLAQIWIQDGIHITKGSAKMNDSYFSQPQYNTPAWHRLVMCQEVGHTFGLAHQDENFTNPNLGTCMDYTSDPEGPPSNEHPDQHDFDQLESIYQHSDLTASASKAPTAMDQIALDGPRQWGRLVRSGNGGRTETYELDFGGGHKVITFVIWVDLSKKPKS